jgi:hypothetical protein
MLIKPRRMRWVGHVVRIGEMRNSYKILGGELRVINYPVDLRIDKRVTLKWKAELAV